MTDRPPQPTPHHVWSGWHVVIVQDVPRGSSPASWLVAWLPRGQRHLWTARDLGDGLWLVANPASTHFHFDVESSPVGDVVGSMLLRGMTCVRVGNWIDTRRVWWRGPLTCVAVAKMQTGCRWPLVWTPGQFIRRAEREGFEVRRP